MDSIDEPPTKIQKRYLMVENDIKSTLKLKPFTLTDLPLELLEKIISNTNIWQHNHLRRISKRMCDVSDWFLMQTFTKALHKNITSNPKSYSSAALQSIKYATEVYINSGHESTFCGCILPLLCSDKEPFCPDTNKQINKFLIHFFNMIEVVINDPRSQLSRLLHCLTIIRLFKRFDKYSIISSTTVPLHWRLIIELNGPWLGMLWSSKSHLCEQAKKRCNLIVILAELLRARITGKAFKRVWESSNEIYVFGNDASNKNHVPQTVFTFTVHGSNKICSLFRSCLEEELENFVWLPKWPKDQFTVNLDIMCKEAVKWGCSKFLHMEFGPFGESLSEEESIEDDLSTQSNES